MSELSSLYCKVKISKSNLEKFLSNPVETPELNKNWLEWWDSLKMYSKMDLTSELLRPYNDENNQEVINSWLKYDQAMAFSDYDEATEEWHWGMLFFSENFVEMLPMFSFIISMEKYITESAENRAIVFPFFWGDQDVSAYIYFENGKAILSSTVQNTSDVNSKIMQQTTDYLNKKWDQYFKEMNLD
ncbi:hypothetical protein ACWA1F_15310 [Flavobacterium sp. 3-218]